MEHIITAQDFFNSGVPVSDDITEQEVTFAVGTLEQFILVDYLGGDLYAQILANNNHQYDAEIALLKQMMYHATFAYMLFDKIRLTRFSSVVKNDEHSTDPSFSDIKGVARLHWEIGLDFLLKVCEKLDVPTDTITHNDLIFNELCLGNGNTINL